MIVKTLLSLKYLTNLTCLELGNSNFTQYTVTTFLTFDNCCSLDSVCCIFKYITQYTVTPSLTFGQCHRD